ncbi:unnamed protein product [Ilex paraguariensis]|uniref:Uncharacterized protein n=1 Tax=Ilex paraguariensis TaxID=185542 RepID=A0ABC8RSS5_9AQUA
MKNFIDLVLGPTSEGTPKLDMSAVVRPSAALLPKLEDDSDLAEDSASITKLHRALSSKLEDDSDLAEDSASITDLVRRQSVEKKRKVIVEPFADDVGGALVWQPWMRAHDRDIHSKDSVADDVDVAGGRTLVNSMKALDDFARLQAEIEKLFGHNEEFGQKLKIAEQSEKVALDVADLVKGLSSSL